MSTTKSLFAPSELVAPGSAKVKFPEFPAASLMVPPFKAKAELQLLGTDVGKV